MEPWLGRSLTPPAWKLARFLNQRRYRIGHDRDLGDGSLSCSRRLTGERSIIINITAMMQLSFGNGKNIFHLQADLDMQRL